MKGYRYGSFSLYFCETKMIPRNPENLFSYKPFLSVQGSLISKFLDSDFKLIQESAIKNTQSKTTHCVSFEVDIDYDWNCLGHFSDFLVALHDLFDPSLKSRISLLDRSRIKSKNQATIFV